MKREALEAARAAEGERILHDSLARHTAEMEGKLDGILAGVKAEVIRACLKHGPMRSPHEAFGIIYEEFNVEFAAEMVANNRDGQALEMNQVAAMAVRFLLDLCTTKQ